MGLIGRFSGRIYANYDIDYAEPRIAEQLPATSLIPKHVFKEVGLYDPVYRGNYLLEESDLYMRVRKRGYVLIYQPEAIAYHFAGFKGGCMKPMNSLNTYLWELINNGIYLFKYYSMRAVPMLMINVLHKLLKLKLLGSKERFERLTIIDKIDFTTACSDFWEKNVHIQAVISSTYGGDNRVHHTHEYYDKSGTRV